MSESLSTIRALYLQKSLQNEQMKTMKRVETYHSHRVQHGQRNSKFKIQTMRKPHMESLQTSTQAREFSNFKLAAPPIPLKKQKQKGRR